MGDKINQIERKVENKTELQDLIGKTFVSENAIVTVSAITIRESKTVYIHAGDQMSFGWTFMHPNGKIVGGWKEIALY